MKKKEIDLSLAPTEDLIAELEARYPDECIIYLRKKLTRRKYEEYETYSGDLESYRNIQSKVNVKIDEFVDVEVEVDDDE
jgi:hypothetical protein